MANQIRKRIAPLARNFNLGNLIRLSAQKDIFPFYHVVASEHLPHIRHLYRYRREDEFEKELDELLTWYEPKSLSDYVQDIKSQGAEKSKRGKKSGGGKGRLVLTFDDGLVESHTVIAPLLKRKGIPATFFLNNHFIDNRGLFYRYRASLIIDEVLGDCRAKEKAAEFLVIPKERVVEAVRLIHSGQQELLDQLARKIELNFVDCLREDPVYMSSQQVQDLVDWGFEIGGHSPDHADFSRLENGEVITQVRASVDDLQQRFGVSTRYFSFPFTSHGVSEAVIDMLLNDGVADVLMGTAGMKHTGKLGFIQRIPIEELEMHSMDALKTEYFYYLLKKPLGKNRLRY